MASLIDTLIDVLGQEDAEYKKLLELSNNKTKAIVGADIERLQDILVQEQAQIDAINKLEQQRMENVDDICNVLNLRRTDIKLEDILLDTIGNEFKGPIIKSENFGHIDRKTVIPIGTMAKIDTSKDIKIKLLENCCY